MWRIIADALSVRAYAIVAIALARSLGVAQAADAPYGFAWSQGVDSLPQPSFATVDANIKGLTYQNQTLPPQFSDTEVVILRVCDGLGLQQVRWFSHSFPLSAAVHRFLDIYEKGVQQYGEADQGDLDHGTAAWSAEHIGMRMDRDPDDNHGYRILMISDGPQFAQCEAEHARITGKP